MQGVVAATATGRSRPAGSSCAVPPVLRQRTQRPEAGQYSVQRCSVHLSTEKVIIGSAGVEKVVELDLTPDEKKNFDKSIEAVRDLYKAAQKIDKSL